MSRRRKRSLTEEKFAPNLALVHVRHSLNLTAREFSQRIGISKSQLDKWENGEHVPRLHSIERVMVALGFRMEVFELHQKAVMATLQSSKYPVHEPPDPALELKEPPLTPYGEAASEARSLIAFLERKHQESSQDAKHFELLLRFLERQVPSASSREEAQDR